MSYRILLVDDDKENLNVNKRLLTNSGYSVVTAESAIEAIETVKNARSDFALVLMDYHMPGEMNGAQAVAEVKKLVPSQQIFAFSMDDTREVMRENFKAGVTDFLDKNSENETVLKTVANACAKYEQYCRTISPGNIKPSEKARFIQDTFMSGAADQTFDLCKEIHKVAPTDATILILGETGTGKEVVAKSIHKLSLKAKGPFIAFNVAAEQTSLIDSSLFGHRKGSFTGASNDQDGKFKLANNGTIFLDEIGDLSLDMQVKLLRVIQEREIVPVGASGPIPINVRIIAATHRNLEKMVAEGTFREDLFYRLNTVILKTTPLRERPEDIEPLVELFTTEICEQYKFRKRFSRQCLEVLKKHRWKGNVRDLRGAIERHFIKSELNEITPKDLDSSLFEEHVSTLPSTMEEIDRHVDDIKKDHLKRVMKSAASKAEAARKLQVAPNRLHYFLNKFGLGDFL